VIPSALAGQLEQGLADFLRLSFWSSTPGMERVIDDLIDEPGAVPKGPDVSLRPPFASGGAPRFFPGVPLGFAPHAPSLRSLRRRWHGGSRGAPRSAVRSGATVTDSARWPNP